MAKYSADLKLRLVQAYESRQLSAVEIREQFGVSARMLLSWYQRAAV